MELEGLKAYIQIHLKTSFIQLFKSWAGIPILFSKKLDGSLRLYIYYQSFNNLIIQNRYTFSLIGEFLDKLG